jgi:hypothetical protein
MLAVHTRFQEPYFCRNRHHSTKLLRLCIGPAGESFTRNARRKSQIILYARIEAVQGTSQLSVRPRLCPPFYTASARSDHSRTKDELVLSSHSTSQNNRHRYGQTDFTGRSLRWGPERHPNHKLDRSAAYEANPSNCQAIAWLRATSN